jgi:hypothetical protein
MCTCCMRSHCRVGVLLLHLLAHLSTGAGRTAGGLPGGHPEGDPAVIKRANTACAAVCILFRRRTYSKGRSHTHTHTYTYTHTHTHTHTAAYLPIHWRPVALWFELQFGARGALLGLGFATVNTVQVTDGDNDHVASNTQASWLGCPSVTSGGQFARRTCSLMAAGTHALSVKQRYYTTSRSAALPTGGADYAAMTAWKQCTTMLAAGQAEACEGAAEGA